MPVIVRFTVCLFASGGVCSYTPSVSFLVHPFSLSPNDDHPAKSLQPGWRMMDHLLRLVVLVIFFLYKCEIEKHDCRVRVEKIYGAFIRARCILWLHRHKRSCFVVSSTPYQQGLDR